MKLRALILALNTLGLLGYFLWLVTGHQQILYTQAGVLYLLPCLPFFFVYFYLYRKTNDEPDEEHPE